MKQFRKILLVLDPEAQRQPALERAAGLARQHGASLHVLTVLEDLPLELKMLLSAPHPGELRENIEQQRLALRQQGLDRLLENPSLAGVQRHLLLGPPEQVIPQIAEREGIELIVMGTVARTGIPGLLIGNTAERILDGVACDVLTIKPEGFITPVTLI